MKKSTLILAVSMFAASALSYASADPQEMAVLAKLKQKYPSTQFKSIGGSPLPGIYEVVMGRNVAYVDETGRYFLFGHLFDMQTQTDLTEGKQPIKQVAKTDFSKLPFENAITIKKGDGSRKLAVFSDPDCPYCKQLEQNLKALDNVTIYLFMFPLEQLHPAAKAKAIGVWCADNKEQAWNELMLNGSSRSGTCANPIEANIKLAQELGINGTPTMILEDGTLNSGAASAERIEQLFQQIKAAKGAAK